MIKELKVGGRTYQSLMPYNEVHVDVREDCAVVELMQHCCVWETNRIYRRSFWGWVFHESFESRLQDAVTKMQKRAAILNKIEAEGNALKTRLNVK